MPRVGYTPPKHPYLYLPDGWNDGWLAAKALAPTSLQTIMFLGDSIQQGYNCSDFSKSYARLLKQKLASAGFPSAAEYWPAYGLSLISGQLSVGTPPFTAALNAASGAVAGGYGWHTHYAWSSTGANSYQQFKSPFACTAMDILYDDYFNGTWKYSVDGGAGVSVTNPWQKGSAAGAQIRRISLSGLASAVHTIDFGWQSVANALFLLGVAAYVPGQASGFQYAYLHCGGMTTNQLYPSILGGAAPSLLGGQKVQSAMPVVSHPTAAPTAAVGAAGNLTGTFYWAVTFVGNGGESAIGSASGSAVLATQQGSLTNVPTGGNGTFQRNVYRATASTGPWGLVGSIADNTTTTYSDNTSAAGAAPPTADPSTSNTGFGFPLGGALAIVEIGANDCNNSTTPDTYHNYLRQVVEGLRRAGAPSANPTSIILHAVMNADPNTTDSQGFNPGAWYDYLQVMMAVASEQRCALINTHADWTNRYQGILNTATPGSPGYLSGAQSHPTDAGHADIANTIMGIL